MTNLFFLSVLLAALGSGLMSGLFFTFSNFVMKALAALPPSHGSSAMQSINVTIINPSFLTVFLGTAACSLASAIYAILNWDQPGTGWVLGGAILYLAGCIVVTVGVNVPLNNQLAAIDPVDSTSVSVWQDYLKRWLPWNHVRTAATLAAATAFIVALCKLNADS